MNPVEYEVRTLAAATKMFTDFPGMTQVEARYEPKVILVAVGVGASSRSALKWADKLAHRLGLGLRLVHAAPDVVPVELLPPQHGVQPSSESCAWSDKLREALHEWATSKLGIHLPMEEFRVAHGQLSAVILREAAAPDVALVVVGKSRTANKPEIAQMLHEVLRHCRRPLLVVGPCGQQPVVLAATDCADTSLPVLRQGWWLAAALRSQLTVVHNVDATASQFGERLGMPFSSQIADLVAQRSQEWLEQNVGFGQVLVTRSPSSARGILSLAAALAAELVVVGVKPAEMAPHRTAEQVLDQARCTVLFVPLAYDGTALADLLISPDPRPLYD